MSPANALNSAAHTITRPPYRRFCRSCRKPITYPRFYKPHTFQCPLCDWREPLDARTQLQPPGSIRLHIVTPKPTKQSAYRVK